MSHQAPLRSPAIIFWTGEQERQEVSVLVFARLRRARATTGPLAS